MKTSRWPRLASSLLACLAWLAFASWGAGCGPSETPRSASPTESTAPDALSAKLSGRLQITGSSTAAPLVTEIALRFEKAHPGVRIDVQSGGSGKGIADARRGFADIGMASRKLSRDEGDLVAHPLAADGVAMIVHATNPVAALTQDEIVAIYTGRIRNWSEVGGPDRSVMVVHKAEGRATLEVFLEHLEIENRAIHPDVIVGDNEHAVKTVAGHPGAVGYVSIGTAEADAAVGVAIKLLPLAGIPATSEQVASGRFPMRRPLLLITRSEISPLVATFVEFCRSSEVHDLIEALHFVPTRR